MNRRLPRAVLALALAVAAPGPARAASRSQMSEADTAALASFRLSMDGVRKVAAANRDFRRIEKMSPGLKARLETKEGSGPETLDESIKRIEAVQQAAAVLKKNHVSARDYVLTTITLFGATMMAGVEKETGRPATLPASLARENVYFVKVHAAELEKLGPEIYETGEERSPAAK